MNETSETEIDQIHAGYAAALKRVARERDAAAGAFGSAVVPKVDYEAVLSVAEELAEALREVEAVHGAKTYYIACRALRRFDAVCDASVSGGEPDD